jgi:Cu(I)/Ag(I) efflux system membrane fusion protein
MLGVQTLFPLQRGANMKLKDAVTISVLCVFAATIHGVAAGGDSDVVDSFVGPYLTIQTSLAGDDIAKAKSGAARLTQAIKSADGSAEMMAYLGTAARQIGEAPDIESARRGFLNLSHQMVQLVKEAGTTGGKALYLAHCPMAFDGEGGSWIQADKTIANPYYGAAMLRCGTVQEQLAGRADETPGHGAAEHHDHHGHQH